MKIKLNRSFITLVIPACANLAAAQGTAFTYQGQLNNGGNTANGSYDLQFTLFSASSGASAVAGPLTNTATAVSSGLFLVTLDFGTGVFTGTNYWLDIAVRTNGTGPFAEMSPRQALTPTPHAIMASTASKDSAMKRFSFGPNATP